MAVTAPKATTAGLGYLNDLGTGDSYFANASKKNTSNVVGRNGAGFSSAANGQVSNVLTGALNNSATPASAFGGPQAYGNTGVNFQGNGSADGQFDWYNPMDWGRDFGDDRLLENGMTKSAYDIKYDANGLERSAANQTNMSEAALNQAKADDMNSFDYGGAINTGLGAITTGASIYDNFWGKGNDIRSAQLAGLNQNILHAGQNQATEKKRVAGVNSMFA